jgi:hypothetical protein
MATSEKQLAANRRNAEKSTGPKTDAGKAVVKYNALTHGLLTREFMLPDEDYEVATDFEAELLGALQPAGPVEVLLADRIILSAWRLLRAARIETESLKDDWTDELFGQKEGIGFAFLRNRNTLPILSRYETALERSLFKALHELQRLQAARAGANVPPPVVVEVDVSGDGGNGFVS